MSLLVALGVGVAGGLGAVARVLLAEMVDTRAGAAFPRGILAVNVSGALLLGVVAGAGLGGAARWIVAVGLLGAYTTFSTWMVDSRRLGLGLGAVNVLGSLALGLPAVWLGRALL